MEIVQLKKNTKIENKEDVNELENNDCTYKNKRLDYIDIVKGIGILLMIIGHMPLKRYPYIKNFIYCFHMPLFFIISGFFFKVRDNKECLKYIFRKLIMPYVITCLVIIGYNVFRLLLDKNYVEIIDVLKVWGVASLYGSGSRVVFGIKPIGAIWFLLALAISTYIMNNIFNKKYSYVYILIIAYIGYKTSKFIWLPFSIQAGMVATLFLYIGTIVKKYKIFEKKFNVKIYVFLISILIFCVIYGGEVYMVSNAYKNGMLDIIGALAGTFLCVKFSQKIETYSKYIKKVIIFIGKNSLICLCVHLISLNCLHWKTFNIGLMKMGIQNETIRLAFLNIMWCIIILMIIKSINKTYTLRKKKIIKDIV